MNKEKKSVQVSGQVEVLQSEFRWKEKKKVTGLQKSATFYRHPRIDTPRFPAGGARSLEKRAVVGA